LLKNYQLNRLLSTNGQSKLLVAKYRRRWNNSTVTSLSLRLCVT
jgi:hypothetical protein